MKASKIIIVPAIFALATVTSCKKDYTCTCTTVVSAASTDIKHSINNANYNDAVKSCKNYENQANSGLPGSTTCHL
jgi:hypothetical protein